MKKKRTSFLTIFSLILLFLIAPTRSIQAQFVDAEEPVVNAIYFYSFECSHCKAVREELLTQLETQYSEQLNILYIEISTGKNYELMIQIEEQFGISAEKRGIHWCYWEFAAGFGIYDISGNRFRLPLLKALLPYSSG